MRKLLITSWKSHISGKGLLTLCIFVLLFACKKESSKMSTEYTFNLKKNAKLLASRHNPGMDYVSQKLSTTLFTKDGNRPVSVSTDDGDSGRTRAEIIFDAASEFIYEVEVADDTYLTQEMIPTLDNILINGTVSLVRNEYDTATQDVLSLEPITSREATLVADFSNILNEAYNMNLDRAQTYSFMESELSRLTDEMSNIAYHPNEGELINGLLEIAKQSNLYWSGHLPTRDLPSVSLVQMDLVGYIFGWGEALREDVMAGDVQPSGQARRIEKGIWGALGFSAGGMKFR